MKIKTNYVIRFRKPRLTLKMKLDTYMFIRDLCLKLSENIFFLLTIIWCLVIFLFSNQVASDSGQLSAMIAKELNDFTLFSNLFLIIPIRKCAHILLYFILGFFVYGMVRCTVDKPYLITLISCYIYACFDEIHQCFISGRSGNIIDTFIDLGGCLLALFVIYVVKKTSLWLKIG